MPIELGVEGGGGGDSFLRGLLGPPRNDFTDASDRDAYATANPTWLASYDADDGLYITVGGQLQHRRSNAWSDATAVLQGGRGPQGGQGDPGPPGATFPAGATQFDVLVAQSAILRAWQRLDIRNLSAALQARIAPEPEASNAGYVVVSDGSGLVLRASPHAAGGISQAVLEAAIRAHAALPNVHHALPTSFAATAITGASALRWGAFTQALEDKLARIQAGAQVNVAPTWAALPDKPTIYVPSDAVPLAESGSGSAGTSTALSRADHYHPLRGITVAQISDFPTLRSDAQVQELARDALAAALTEGANVSITSDDAANTITVAVTSFPYSALTGAPSIPAAAGSWHVGTTAPSNPAVGDGWWNTSTSTLSIYNGTTWVTSTGGTSFSQAQIDEFARDAVGAALTGSGGITITPNDTGDSIAVALGMVDWNSQVRNRPTIPTLPTTWDGSEEVNSVRLFSPNQLLDTIARETQTWSQTGNTDDIPASKLPPITRAMLTSTLQGWLDNAFVSIIRHGDVLRFGQNDGSYEGLDFADIAAAAAAATGNDRLSYFALRDAPTIPTVPTTWPYSAITGVPMASETEAGIVELATDAEAVALSTHERAITPSNLAAFRPNADPLPPARVAERGNSGRNADELHVHPVGSTPPVVATHTRRLGISADNAFTAAEFTVSSTSGNLTFPASISPASVYIAFAVPATTDDLTAITPIGGFNEILEFERVPGTLTIGGVEYKVWRSAFTWIATAIQGTTWNLDQRAV